MISISTSSNSRSSGCGWLHPLIRPSTDLTDPSTESTSSASQLGSRSTPSNNPRPCQAPSSLTAPAHNPQRVWRILECAFVAQSHSPELTCLVRPPHTTDTYKYLVHALHGARTYMLTCRHARSENTIGTIAQQPGRKKGPAFLQRTQQKKIPHCSESVKWCAYCRSRLQYPANQPHPACPSVRPSPMRPLPVVRARERGWATSHIAALCKS